MDSMEKDDNLTLLEQNMSIFDKKLCELIDIQNRLFIQIKTSKSNDNLKENVQANADLLQLIMNNSKKNYPNYLKF